MSDEDTQREIEDLRARLDALAAGREEVTPPEQPTEKRHEDGPEAPLLSKMGWTAGTTKRLLEMFQKRANRVPNWLRVKTSLADSFFRLRQRLCLGWLSWRSRSPCSS